MLDNEITLNSLEHYVFCHYQWWLNIVENEWVDNIHTIQGEIVHSKVDDKNFCESRGNVRVERSVPLFSDALGLYGIADLIEYKKNDGKLVKINIVEYKKGAPDKNKQIQIFDGLQLYGQMVCARAIFGCQVDGYIYYASIRKRIKLKDENFFAQLLEKTLNEMRTFLATKQVPNKNIGKHCNACSFKDICLPFVGEINAKIA